MATAEVLSRARGEEVGVNASRNQSPLFVQDSSNLEAYDVAIIAAEEFEPIPLAPSSSCPPNVELDPPTEVLPIPPVAAGSSAKLFVTVAWPISNESKVMLPS